jgi:hypothetical protein
MVKKKQPPVSVEEARRGIYIDFEGTMKDPASFLGVLVVGDGGATEFEKIEVPGDLVIELVKGTKGQFHHRGLTENDIELSADDAARLFKPDSTYTIELFEV